MTGVPTIDLVLVALLGALAGALVVALVLRRSDEGALRAPLSRRNEAQSPVVSVLRDVRRPMLVVDPRLRVVATSADAEELGLHPGEELRHPPLRAAASTALSSADGRPPVSRDVLRVGEVTSVRVDVEVRASRLADGGVLLDIEDRSEAVRVEAVRRDFVVNVSHELKTPVGAISILAETMAEAADDPEAVRRFSSRMQRECARLASLVADIIVLSRVQGVDAPARIERVRLDLLAQEAVDHLRPLADAAGITIVLGTHEAATISGDHDLLLTATRNLLVNAVTYSGPGTRVSCVVHRREGRVDLVVADRGIGIPVTEQERVFERFYRVDPARSRATGGTGLGLAIVKHIVEKHRGDIVLWSRPGQGSTFTLRFPDADTSPPLVPRRTSTEVPPRRGPATYGGNR